MLDLAGIPFRAADRDEKDPLVIGGGPCALNPEPLADFFDLFVLGDGEEVILEICGKSSPLGKKGRQKKSYWTGFPPWKESIFLPFSARNTNRMDESSRSFL